METSRLAIAVFVAEIVRFRGLDHGVRNLTISATGKFLSAARLSPMGPISCCWHLAIAAQFNFPVISAPCSTLTTLYFASLSPHFGVYFANSGSVAQ